MNENTILLEINKLTDWYTDILFSSSIDESVVVPFSRIFCDVERFLDDEKEVMAKSGMGVIYRNTDCGERLREISPLLKKKILNDYYKIHHRNLITVVNKHLEQFQKALILDCHSYPDKPLFRDLNQHPNRPDFNIGTDPFHTSQKLIDISVDYFNSKGFSIGIDWPYSGTIVTENHYQKCKEVESIMLEVNRKLYMNEYTLEKSENFNKINKIIIGYMNTIRDYLG